MLLFLVSLIALSSSLILRELMIKDFKQYLEGVTEDRIYQTIAEMEGLYERYSKWNKELIAEKIANAFLNGFDIRLRDPNGNIIMDRQRAVEMLTPYMKRRFLALSSLIEGRVGSERTNKNEEFIPYPLFLKGSEIGTLEVRFIKSPKEETFVERSNRFMLFSLIGLGAFSVILSIFFSRRLTAPINRLSSAAEAIRSGNLKVRVPVRGVDEIARLSEIFNSMAKALEIQENLRKTLISNVAHELRTPLGVIRGELEGMMDGLIPVNEEQLKSLHEEIKRLSRLVEGIEELSQAQAGVMNLRRQEILLRPFLENILGLHKVFLQKGISIELTVDPKFTLRADPEKLSQIITNLLSNSLKATDPGGKIWIKAWKENKDSIIEIGDTGAGISQEDLPFIFERFFKRFSDGIGIGLSIVKELVEAHGGKIHVRSESGKGTVFTIVFPEDIHNFS